MSITGRIIDALTPLADLEVEDIRLGLVYTAARLADGRAGVAYTFSEVAYGGCGVFQGKRPLAGRPAGEILPLLASSDPIEAAVGLAVANALIPVPDERRGDSLVGDVVGNLELLPTDLVGMVGHFGPVLPQLRQRVDRVLIFERIKEAWGELLPQNQAYQDLPRCQAAVITSTTLLNGTLEPLLAAAGGCREVALLGPSTPLLPQAFRDTPVKLLSGVEVLDGEKILQVVSEAGGMRQFKGLIRKISIRIA